MKSSYVLHTLVKEVKEQKVQRHIEGMGKDAIFEDVSAGWYVVFDLQNPFALYLGETKPVMQRGDMVKLTIEVTEKL